MTSLQRELSTALISIAHMNVSVVSVHDAGNSKLPLLANASLGVREAIVCELIDEDGAQGFSYANLLGIAGLPIGLFIQNSIFPRLKNKRMMGSDEWWPILLDASLDAYFMRHLAMRAISAVDCALWDLFGRKVRRRLSSVFDGDQEAASCLALMSRVAPDCNDNEFACALEKLVSEGYAGAKIKVGRQTKLGPKKDAARMRFARRIVGPEFGIAPDANQSWSSEDAILFSLEAEGAGLLWLEEPCHWHDDKRLLATVKAQSPIPLTAGQAEISWEGCRDLLDSHSVDICNFDATVGGGATAWLKARQVAQVAGKRMIHHIEPQIGLTFGTLDPTFLYFEICTSDIDPFFYRLVANTPDLMQGKMRLGSEFGWGWILDRDYLTAHCTATFNF